MAECRDRGTDVGIAGRLHRKIAFRVEAHGAVAEIRRPHAGQLVVDDAHLRMHADADAAEPGDARVIQPEAAVPVHRPQPLEHASAQHVHGVLFQPSVAVRVEHQHDLRADGLGQPPLQHLRNRSRGQILCFEVDVPPCRPEGIDVQPFDFPDFRSSFEGWHRPSDPDRHVSHIGFHPGGPGIVAVGQRLVRDGPPRRRFPAVARQPAQRRSRPSVHRHLHVVKGTARLAVGEQTTRRMIRPVVRRIPTALGKVQPAHECHAVVHHRHFLMVRRSDRMPSVLIKMQAAVGRQFGRQPPFPLTEINHVVIPREDEDMEIATAHQ